MRTSCNTPQILLATSNPHKVEEINVMLIDADIKAQVVSILDYPHLQLPEETEDTLEGNAILKAKAAAENAGLISLADDSGLEVDALGGAPGVRSKRFAGEQANDSERCEKLLDLLRDVPEEKRQARFRCCMAIVVPGEKPTVVEGICSGKIAFSPIGHHGFGYDPVFIPNGKNCTMAQLTMEEKNRISHRYRALQETMPVLKRLIDRLINRD